MGCTLTDIPIDHAKTVARAPVWVVFEASTVKYFQNKRWLKDVVRAERIHERDEIRFTMKNSEWCTVERNWKKLQEETQI